MAKGFPQDTWTPSLWAEFQNLLTKMREIDERLGLKDCEDAAKASWMADIEKRLSALEALAPKKATVQKRVESEPVPAPKPKRKRNVQKTTKKQKQK